MKIEKIETRYDRYVLEFQFRFPLDGEQVLVWITAYHQHDGGRSGIEDVNGLVDQLPEYVKADLNEKFLYMPAQNYPDFVSYIAQLDPSWLFRLLDKDRQEGEWS